MAEERWHDFAKEKPSEDMEGRNFIVSNGHYEKIATWCGYWENEPFMGDRLCDEVVRWKLYFTPEEEEEACEAKDKDVAFWRKEYDEETKLTDALKAEIESLKARIQLDDDEMAGFLQLEEECGGGDLRNYIAELNAKLAEKVDAGMENNILKRALWLTRALRARDIQRWWLQVTCSPRTEIACRKWNNVERKCRAKAEEYK